MSLFSTTDMAPCGNANTGSIYCITSYIEYFYALPGQNTNFLLTERKGRTGEYWPEFVAVRTERSSVRTKTTEGQYSSVPSRASEVSK